jgi:rod shape-determining protein MreD
MVAFCFWLLGIAIIVVQTTLLQYFPSWLGRPDFLFILVAFIAYRFAWVPGIALVFSLSYIMDVVAGIHLGFYPIGCLVTFTVLKFLTTKSPIKETTYQIPLVGLAYFVLQILLYFIYSLTWPETLPQWSWGEIFRQTALVMVSAIPLFILCNSFYEMLRKRQIRGKPPRRRRT